MKFIFQIKKYDKNFQGYDLDYLFKYSEEVPLKYKTAKSRVASAARLAEENMAHEMSHLNTILHDMDGEAFFDALEVDMAGTNNGVVDECKVPAQNSTPPPKNR